MCFFMMSNSFTQTTTVITHGFSTNSDMYNSWMLDMAIAIRSRQGDAVIRIYNKTTGNFDYYIGSGNKTILVFNWESDSNDLILGYSEGAGAALFAALIKGFQQNDFDLSKLHLIGHSRGCAVMSETAERLLKLGYPVEQVTFLDAHDWGVAGVCADTDCNPDSLKSGVEGWNGITWADSYWQNATFDLDGRAVEGTHSTYLGTIGHNAVHDWYYNTIIDSTIHDGFYYTLSGGGSAYRLPVTGLQRDPLICFETEGILNGDFSRGIVLSNAMPGWWYHGGGGNAMISNGYLVINSGGYNKIHDRFYIPPDMNKIKFDYEINTIAAATTDSTVEKLKLFIDSTLVDSVLMDSVMQNWREFSFDISKYKNFVHTMELRLIDKSGGTSNIKSEVWIDNVQFVKEAPGPVINSNNLVYPNPFIGTTNILYTLPQSSYVKIKIFNCLGKEIKVLYDGYSEAGQYKIVFNGIGLSAGIYFYCIQFGNKRYSGKMVLIK